MTELDQKRARQTRAPAVVLLGLAALAPFFAMGCEGSTFPEDETIDQAVLELAPSANPPGGLAASVVPQFVSVSFDDNFSSEGMNWATSYFQNKVNPAGLGNPLTFDGTSARTTFFHNSTYLSGNESSWGAAKNAGHETADHTVGHPNGLGYNVAQWTSQVRDCRTQLASGLGITQASIKGFRAPYLGYNDALYTVLASESPAFLYDSSIQSCWGASENGSNCSWPYTLDGGSPDAANVLAKFGSGSAAAVNAHAGFWEVPVTTLIVPPDSVAAQYGFSSGLRARVQTALGGNVAPSFYEQSTGKVAGLDITLIVDGKMTKAEALATLKYTLDLHLAGNRAPLVFVAHTHVYANGYGAAPNVQATADRRAIVEEFINYALTKSDVRVRPMADIVAWSNSPSALGACTPSCGGKQCGSDGCGGVCGTGTCPSGQTCNASQQCVAACTPDCNGKQCGSDGCGGVCGAGTCPSGQTCNASQQCITGSCSAPAWSASQSYGGGSTVSYSGKEYTANWYTLNERPDLNNGPTGSGKPWKTGVACGGSCTPSCNGKQCGSDGCGGVCGTGTCPSGQTCNASQQCVSTCTPACSGKECGSDGCGGVCGTCTGGETCNASQECVSTCTPACSGKECGSDGCGGVCGTCASGKTCNASQLCVASTGCGGLPTWVSGTSYSAGARVQGGGNIYECKAYPYTGWCGAGSAYQPGVGFAWSDAWTLVGACN